MLTRRGGGAWTVRRRGGANGAAARREGERMSCRLQRVASHGGRETGWSLSDPEVRCGSPGGKLVDRVRRSRGVAPKRQILTQGGKHRKGRSARGKQGDLGLPNETLGHSQPRLYLWSLYLEDSIIRNYIL
jgi:hypothetical protein